MELVILAEAKPAALWIAETPLEKLQPPWLKFLRVCACVCVCEKLSDCDRAYARIY